MILCSLKGRYIETHMYLYMTKICFFSILSIIIHVDPHRVFNKSITNQNSVSHKFVFLFLLKIHFFTILQIGELGVCRFNWNDPDHSSMRSSTVSVSLALFLMLFFAAYTSIAFV